MKRAGFTNHLFTNYFHSIMNDLQINLACILHAADLFK